MAAASEAFEKLSHRTMEERGRIIEHIRRISIDQCVELGTMEMEETKIGRLEHKIEKLKTLGERTPGIDFMRSEVFSGDHGLAVIYSIDSNNGNRQIQAKKWRFNHLSRDALSGD